MVKLSRRNGPGLLPPPTSAASEASCRTQRRGFLSCLAALSLAACGTVVKPEPAVRVVEVKVPVLQTCVPRALPSPPTYPDSDSAIKAAPEPGDLLQLLAAGRLLRNQRLAETEPIITGCR